MVQKASLEDYQKAYRLIRTREERMALAAHAVSYVIFSVAFVAVNLIITPDTIWFPFPLVGWGLIVAAHFIYVLKWLEKELEGKERLAERLAGDRPAASDGKVPEAKREDGDRTRPKNSGPRLKDKKKL